MKLIAAAFACFLSLIPAEADITVQAENGDGQNTVNFQVITQAEVELSFEILGAPTSANCAPIDPSQQWGCLGGLYQYAFMGSPDESGNGGANMSIYGDYGFVCEPGVGCTEDPIENLQYDCDGTVCGSAGAPWCGGLPDGLFCTSTLAPGSYSISVGDNDGLASGLPAGTPGNSTVIPFNESVEATLYVESGIVTPEPGSMALLFLGFVVFLSKASQRGGMAGGNRF